MHRGHSPNDPAVSSSSPTVTSFAAASSPRRQAYGSLIPLDPSHRRPVASPTSPRLRKLPASAAVPARLPRSSSLLPLPRLAAAATTTPTVLSPVYSPSETPSYGPDPSSRPDVLPDTPPNESDFDTDPVSATLSARIELSTPLLPPLPPLGSPGAQESLGERVEGRPSSLEVLPGGDASDIEIPEASPGRLDFAGASGLSPKMPYDKAREAHVSSRNLARGRHGKSSVDLPATRAVKPMSQKSMLSQALQKANMAVQLDNIQNFNSARQSYAEACELLQHVLRKTVTDEDKRKLEAIHRTYSGRIVELDRMASLQEIKHKRLPTSPRRGIERDDELGQSQIVGSETFTAAVDDSFRSEMRSLQPKQQRDVMNFNDGSHEHPRSAFLHTKQAPLHSTFSRPPKKIRSAEQHVEDDKQAPKSLTIRQAPSPQKLHHERERDESEDRGSETLLSGAFNGPRDGAGHLRVGSRSSWLDPIDESGGSTSASDHSETSSAFHGQHSRGPSGNTEAEFETALDAAIEAAYDEGYEPPENRQRDTMERTEEIVNKALRKVEEARERIRQNERDAYPDAGVWNAQTTQDLNDDNLSSDEEERILEEMTRDYVEDFMMIDEGRPQIHKSHDPEYPAGAAPLLAGDPSGPRSLTATTDGATMARQSHIPESLQPSLPPPKHSLPDLPLARVPSPGQTVRNRRLSGQNPKQLMIHTPQFQPSTINHVGSPKPKLNTESIGNEEGGEEKQEKDEKEEEEEEKAGVKEAKEEDDGEEERDHEETQVRGEATAAVEVQGQKREESTERPRTGLSVARKITPPYAEVPTIEAPLLDSPPHRRGQYDGDDLHTARTGSPTIRRLRKNFSTSSLRSIKTRNLSNPDDASDLSPGTPFSNQFGGLKGPVIPALPTPLAPSLREQMDLNSPSTLHLFEDNIHLPATPGSPNPMASEPPVALEPCPNDVMLRPFWLMRCLYQTLVHPRGGYLSTKLFVPRDVWKIKSVKLKNIEDKISNCDLLTAALLKLAKVDTCDADAVLDEMQSLESVMEQVQNALSRKLGNEVGVQGSGLLFKEASSVIEGDGASGAPRAASVSSKPSSFSWRRLRSKSSNMGLTGAYGGKSAAAAAAAAAEGLKESMTLSSLPMTSQPTSRPPKRDIAQVHFLGPNAHYMDSLARLFDAAQAIDQIARQVDDPGLRHADKTQVGLELSTRHAAEFFCFYVCRFVLTDLGLLMDKFIKRGTEWVLS